MSKETIEDFLARGGKITIVPPQESEDNRMVKSTVVTSQKLYPLGHTVLSNPTKKKKRAKTANIEWDLIPKELHHLRMDKEEDGKNNTTTTNDRTNSSDDGNS